jgi:small subunit ribosomal protein S9
MSDETNETSEQQPVDETTEGQTEATAGPVADEAPSSSQAAGEDAPSAPPADEAGETPTASTEEPGEDAAALAEDAATEDETSAEEAAPAAEESLATEAAPVTEGEAPAEEQPAAEAEAPAAPPQREERKKEEKKDVIPGANLEPIAIEPQGRELSAEERAALEAEEEEKARREAELAAAESDSAIAERAPAKMESGARFLATGKRKSSIARVILKPGDGQFIINGRELAEFFPRPLHQTMVKQPLTVSGYEGNVDVRVRVHGGGVSGQAGAVRHGIAKALTEIDAELRGDLKRRGFLTRDARVKERRKAGFKKARKKPQFSKR